MTSQVNSCLSPSSGSHTCPTVMEDWKPMASRLEGKVSKEEQGTGHMGYK